MEEGHYIYCIEEKGIQTLRFLRDRENKFVLRYIHEYEGSAEVPDRDGSMRDLPFKALAVFINNNWHTVGLNTFDQWSFTLPVFNSEIDAGNADLNAEEWLKASMI